MSENQKLGVSASSGDIMVVGELEVLIKKENCTE